MSDKHIIEINGVKLEVDLRTAKRIESFKVGDNVKVLVKEYQAYASYPGVIVGFDEFKTLPTIVICYVKTGYCPEVKFCYFNSASTDIEICTMQDYDKLNDFVDVENTLDKEILKKENEMKDLIAKKAYFVTNYNKHFTQKESSNNESTN